jgi:hypothetical protein
MIDVVLEVGTKRTFASALDWPGWSRSGRDEAGALAQLAAYASRYGPVAAQAGFPLPEVAGLRTVGDRAGGTDVDVFSVVERVRGDATTDFGAPGTAAEAESVPLGGDEALRRVALLRSCWEALDEVVATAPEVLRKGPRGGGRDRDAIFTHVCDAELAYARKLGIRDKALLSSVTSARQTIAEVLSAPSDGSPLAERGWTARYAVRRIAWHALDHAWEIEDRSET